MTYEPSKELIEQIAEEVYELNKCNLGWEDEIDFVKHHKLSFQNAKNYCKLPTFNKALELYENQPKWQDKPDKEGWWWYVRDDSKSLNIYYLTASASGELKTERIPLATDLRVKAYPGKWLYIPEPEPYKGED